MMDNDIKLIQSLGKAYPFRVPEGYFKAFNERMMNVLPEREQGSTLLGWHRYRLLLCAVASVCGLIFGVYAFLHHYDQVPDVHVASSHDVKVHDKQMEEMADYMMLDDDDIVRYLASND